MNKLVISLFTQCSTPIFLLSSFSYILSVKYIKTVLISEYSTISMQNIKESLLGTFCAFSYRPFSYFLMRFKFFKILIKCDLDEFLVSKLLVSKYTVPPNFFLRTFYFANLLGTRFQKT